MVMSTVSVTHSAFVGRESELKDMSRLMQDALVGKGNFTTIKGEAGIGKTRLMSEFAKLAMDEGFDFLTGRCLSLEQADPYLPFTEAMKEKMGSPQEKPQGSVPIGLMGVANSSSRQDVPLGLLGIAGSTQADVTSIDIQTEKDKLFDNILSSIVNNSSRKPIILFIDDLQWADVGTLQLLLFIARNITSNRVMLCTAFRTEEVDSEGRPLRFYEEFRQMSKDISYNTMALDRLNQNEIGSMINSILSISDVPTKFVSKLYSESEGNPFFVEEVLRSLMDEGIILRHGHIWDAGVDLSTIRIPNTIKDVITHRIARLGEVEKKILRYAAVAGDNYTFDVLREVTKIDDELLLDSIDALMEADIIQEVPNSEEEEYHFDHKLIRSVIYDSMSKSRVRLMHKSVGEAIENLYSNDLDRWVFDLARHFSLGKHSQKNYQYSIMAGEKAFNSLALDRAVDYYVSALRTMDLLSPSEDFDRELEKQNISMMVGNLYSSISLWNSATKYYENALKASQKRRDEKGEVLALISIGHSKRSLGNYSDAEKDYEKAAESAKKTNDVQSLGEIERGLGYVHWRKGENDEAIEHYNQGISFSMKAGDMSSMAKTFIELGNVYNHWGQHEKAIEYYSKSLIELEKLDDYSELARAYNNMGDTYLQQNQWEKAIESFDKCQEASEKIGNKNMLAWALFNSSEALAYTGELDKAENNCINALNICETQDDKIGMNGVFRCLGIIYRFKEDWNRAIENFNKSITILEMLDIPYDLGDTYFQLGTTYEQMNELLGAKENYQMAIELFDTVGAKNQAEEAKDRLAALEK
ncbi:MAG: tetratricopeptide repeat protein [Thermoplasmata archaeon]|nr:tetratricopeptide repeat protein [Thermoplasmata archaeon]